MTINAQRFESLRDDFNVPVTDFKSITDNDIQNSPMDMLNEAKENAKGLLEQLSQAQESIEGSLNSVTEGLMDGLSGAKDALAGALGGADLPSLQDVKNKLGEATRVTQNLFGTFTDLSKLPESMIGGFIDSIIPNDLPILGNAIRNLSKVCRNNALGGAMGFGGMQNAKCGGLGGSIGNCPPGPAANLLSGAGLGALNDLINAGKNILGKILALANIGFNANLCGVFGALTQELTDNSIIGMAAGILVNQQGLKNNIRAVTDISKTTIARGINVSHSFPMTIKNVTAGITSLGLNTKNDKFAAAEAYHGALEGLDPTWYGDTEADISRVSIGEVMSDSSSMVLCSRTPVFGNDAPPMSSQDAALAVMASMQA